QVQRRLDAVRFVPHTAPIPLFFQFARQERVMTEAHMKRYADAAKEPKQVVWYDAGHELLDVQAVADRLAWLEKHLHTPPVAPILRRKVGAALEAEKRPADR